MNPNYTTLNKDIGLVQRSNNGWDLWFENGDTVKADDFHSLQTGIILACLTSWNYLNRYGNPTYETFGNRAYELLKENKSSMVAYKIQQYFIECLKRMRRVYEIVYLEVSETPSEPYKYLVEFEVISVNNQLVNGSFNITTDTKKSTSYIEYTTYMPYASNENPLIIDLYLKNEYGGGLGGEILYMYIQKGNGDYQFMGVVGQTDENGYLRVVYEPTENNENNVIYFDFQGNTNYNPSTSERTTFKTELYEYYINFINNNIVNNEIVTYNNYANLKLKLRKKSLLDEKYYDVENTPITVIGDGLADYPNKTTFYNAVTDANGEATIRANIEENTLFTTSYNNSTSYVNVTIIKQNPTITFTTNKSQLLMGEFLELRAIVKDEFNKYIKNYEVIFKDGEEIIGSATTDDNGLAILSINTLLAKTYSFTANTNSTNFYEAVESDSVSVTIDKHIPTVDVSVEEPPLVVGNDIMVTAMVTEIVDETVSNLFNLSVKFTDENNEELDTVLCSDGVANLLVGGLSVGEHTITATVIANDYYVSANDSVTFNIINPNYDLSFDVNRINSSIVDEDSINHIFRIVPYITDNGLSVSSLDLTNNPIVLSCNESGDEWIMTNYVQDEVSFEVPYVSTGNETVSFTITWGELELTKQLTTPIWEDKCGNDFTNLYSSLYLNKDLTSTQVVSNTLCSQSWHQIYGNVINMTNSSMTGEYRGLIVYTATQPLEISITSQNADNWGYVGGIGCLVVKSDDETDVLEYEEQIEEIGHENPFTAILNTGDKLVLRFIEESQSLTYVVKTLNLPQNSFYHNLDQQTYCLSSEDTDGYFIGKCIPKNTNSHTLKASCKVRLSSNSDNQFMIGLTNSDFEDDYSIYWDVLRVNGNGEAEYYQKTKTHYSSGAVEKLSLWEDDFDFYDNEWVKLELDINGRYVTGTVYDETNTVLATTTQQGYTYSDYNIFIGANGENIDYYVKDILITPREAEPIEPTQILFEDDCSSSTNLNKYDTPINVRNSGTATLSYDSNGYYKSVISGTSAYQTMYPIPSIIGTTDFKFSMELYPESGTNCGVGLCVFNDNSNFFSAYTQYQNHIYETSKLNNSEIDTSLGDVSVMNKWQKYEYIVNSTTGKVTLNIYSIEDDSLVFTTTRDLRITINQNTKIGLTQTWQNGNMIRVRNIKVEEIE